MIYCAELWEYYDSDANNNMQNRGMRCSLGVNKIYANPCTLWRTGLGNANEFLVNFGIG